MATKDEPGARELLLREHAQRGHVTAPRLDCPACRKFVFKVPPAPWWLVARAEDWPAAGNAALDRDALVERHATSLYAYDMRSFPAAHWEGEGAAMQAACRDRAQVALVAIGLIPEAPKESHDQ